MCAEWIANLKKAAPSLGMTIGPPKQFVIPDSKPATYMAELDKVIGMGPALVMVIIPNNKVRISVS